MTSLTIFTPIYNRAYIIDKLYSSLLQQTTKDFEWIIINDGSTDDIDAVVKKWMDEKKHDFDITYLSVENQGKHNAINKGVENAKGDMFFIVDSDDFLVSNAVKLVIENEKNVPKEKFAGFSFNRGYSEEKIIGSTFEGEYVDATSLERSKYNIKGDKAEIFYTEVLRKYPFPIFKGENYLTEAVIWYKIANDEYKIRWFNQIIYICNYLPDGLSLNNTLDINNFNGYTYAVKQFLIYKMPLIEKVKIAGNYMNTARYKKLTFTEAGRKVNKNVPYLFTCYMLYLLKKYFSIYKGEKVEV